MKQNCNICINKSDEENTINLICLECKWEYPGQDAFDRKQNLFISEKIQSQILRDK